MNSSQFYIFLSIVVLAVIAFLVLIVNRNKKRTRLTPLAGLAFGFVLAGILLGEYRLVGYGLMGVGVILAVVDMLQKRNIPT
jgi:hypothetical protein